MKSGRHVMKYACHFNMICALWRTFLQGNLPYAIEAIISSTSLAE